jgi:hypothetical protein
LSSQALRAIRGKIKMAENEDFRPKKLKLGFVLAADGVKFYL